MANSDLIVLQSETLKGIWVRDYSKGILEGWVRVSTGSVKCMERFYKAFVEIDEI